MFVGLSAFPLTPLNEQAVDEAAFTGLMQRLVAARVDSIGVLGSTGSYAYLTRAERARIAALAVQHADGIPVLVGIGALRTRAVLELAQDAQRAGAAAVLLAPVSYQKLHDDEVFGLYEAVARELSVPLCVYDNPATTQFSFSDELHARIAALPAVRSIKLPPVPADPARARERVQRLRALIPARVSLGISGDASAATGLNAGCEAWYSALGGLFPEPTLALMRQARAGRAQEAVRLSQDLDPLWALFARHGGSLRVIATAAELLSLVQHPCLPLPLRSLDGAERQAVADCLQQLGLAT
jgi:4-hydroxy-tetrahydrodipicolinate synthase